MAELGRSFYETPGNSSETAMADLDAWLTTLGLERYAPAFAAAEVEFATLPHLTEEDLKEIGLPLGPRRRLLAAIAEGARPTPGPPVQETTPERRQITVMFVDLVGSTRLSVEVDPEDLADLLKRYKDLVAREIAAAGGRVAKYLGDGVLAYFGWPHAREDAAESSIRCGFEVIGQVGRLTAPDGQPLRSRVGIATGLVVVGGETGEGSAREDAIAGEALNLAARLQACAPPDAMVISQTTHRQIGQLFECEPLGELTLDGFSTPVRAWRALRPSAHQSRFRAARAVRTSFVGREHELSLLADRWDTAREGTGRTVLVLGEAGMGKSRLGEALHDHIRHEPHGFATWQCSPYHQTKALYPIVEYILQSAGIADADSPSDRLTKLTDLLGAIGEGAVALFAHLLVIPPEAGYSAPALAPNQLREATIAALGDWIRRIAASKPLYLLVEDAHWIDATTLELIAQLVGAMVDTPMLTVVTARPEFASPWTGRADVSIIGLDRLNSRDCEGMVREIAASVGPLAEVVKEIVARSDGNPLFLEELTAAVFEARGSAGQAVPDSLQSSLMARLDQLGGAKHTAQVCSVLGRRFARPLLTHVAGLAPAALDANLALLVAHDIIRPVGGPGEDRYVFKHALVRDAAYESLLLSERRRLHEACGRRLEQSFPETVRTEPELLAQHFRLAGLPEEASGYAEQAGDLAATTSAMVESIASYEDALKQAELQPEAAERDRRILRLLLKLGPAVSIIHGPQHPMMRDIYRRAEALSRTDDDRDALFKAVWGLWYHANIARELDDASSFAQQLVVISRQSGDEDHALEALHCSWSSKFFRGDCPGCATDCRRGTELYDMDRHRKLGPMFGGHDPGVCAHGCLGQVIACAGDVAGGIASVRSAIALAETLEHANSLGHGLLTGLIVTTAARSSDLVRSYAERMLELGRKFNVPPQQATGAYHLAWVEAETGERSKGLEQMGELYDRVTRMGPMTLLYKVMYIEQLLKSGRTDTALSVADKAVAELRFPDIGFCMPELYRLRGECLAGLGRKGEGIAEIVRAEAMAKRDGAALFRLRAAASLHRAQADERSKLLLETTLAVIPADQAAPDLDEARALLGR
jgi:class 3 adenylate cyclase